MIELLHGDCRELLSTLPDKSVQMCVTSPPYWGLRKYSDDPREIGGESTPAEYVQALLAVFTEVWRVLRDDGTLWINLGDAYANDTKWGGKTSGKHAGGLQGTTYIGRNRTQTGLPSKSLIGLPWRVAFALQDAGWILRCDIIWHKPSVMPENVKDRPTRSHEYLFLFSKQSQYYYDAPAVYEACESGPSDLRKMAEQRDRIGGKTLTTDDPKLKASLNTNIGRKRGVGSPEHRNRRSVWTIATQPLRDAHFAAFPQGLVEPCILAGSRAGDTVLDPFVGSGTVARVCERLQRSCIGIDLAYQELQAKRTDKVQVEMFV